jgi:hypothetical protein
MNIANIKRIRWAHTESRHIRWYGFSTSIMLNAKSNDGSSVIKEEVDERNWCGLTVQGRKVVNSIIRSTGVTVIYASAHSMSVGLVPIYQWDDGFHEEIMRLLNQSLFNGTATILEPALEKAA